MFKKSLAILLSVIMLLSVISTGSISAIATDTDSVKIIVKSAQGLFNDVEKVYKINDTFEFTFFWQNELLFRGIDYNVNFDNTKLKVTADSPNPELEGILSNITDEVQETRNLVSANYSHTTGFEFKSGYINKYTFKIKEVEATQEIITLNIKEAYGNHKDVAFPYVDFVYNSKLNEENKDLFSCSVALSDAIPDQSESTKDTEDVSSSSNPPVSDSSGDSSSTSSDPTESNSSGTTDPTESNSSNTSDPTESDSSSSTSSDPTESNSSGTTDPTESDSSDNTDPTESSSTDPTEDNNETEPTESTATKAPSAKLKKAKIKAGATTNVVLSNAKGKKVKYKSLNTKVAKVNKKGVVTGLNKGSAKISITIGTKVIKKTLRVISSPKIKLGKKELKSKATIVINKGSKKVLKISGKAKAIKNNLTFKSKKFFKITSKANQPKVIIKGLKKGKSTLTVKINGVKTYKFSIRVK